MDIRIPFLFWGVMPSGWAGVPPAFSLVNESGSERPYRVYYDAVSRSVIVKSTKGTVMMFL